MKRRSFTWAQFVSRLLVDDMLSRETRNRHGWTNVSRQLIMVQPFMRRFLYSIPSSGENPFKQRKLGIERDVVSCLYEIASNKNVIQQLRSNFWKTRFVTTSSWDGWYSLCTSHERAWPTREILKQTSANHDSWSAVPVSMARPTRRREWNSAWPWETREWSWRAEKFVCLEAVFGSPMVQPRIKIRNQIVGPWRIFSSLFVSRETNPWPWNYVWLVHNFLMAKNVTAREIDEWSNQNLFQKILCLAVTSQH